MLYRIGEFSKITNIPIKTLRYYDEIGLLKPEEIDIFTNYRYYGESNKEDLKIILELKSVGFTLEEIKNNWDNFNNEVMLEKKKELLQQATFIEEQIKKIDKLRSEIVNNRIMLDKQIEKPTKVLRIR